MDFMTSLVPKLTLTLVSPLCCCSFFLAYTVHFSPLAQTKSRMTRASSMSSFLCGLALFTVIINYNIQDSVTPLFYFIRVALLLLGMMCNDSVVLLRMFSLSHRKLTLLFGLACVLTVAKFISGLAMICTLLVSLLQNQDTIPSMPLLRLFLQGGEMSTMLCFALFWLFFIRRHRSEAESVTSKSSMKFVLLVVRNNVIICSILVIILWSITIYTDWTYQKTFDYFTVPAYFFILCPSSLIALAKDLRNVGESGSSHSSATSKLGNSSPPLKKVVGRNVAHADAAPLRTITPLQRVMVSKH